MKNQEVIKKVIQSLPDTPGVYLFKCKNRIVYIGKATSLKDRVRSYFNKDIVETRSPLISKMLEDFDIVDHIKTDSVLEALVLEASLIKKYQPEANVLNKDNKSFNFVVITKEDFPRVLVMRGRDLLNSKKIPNSYLAIYRKTVEKRDFQIMCSFGPFPNGMQLREALKIVRKMFPYRDDKCVPYEEQIRKYFKKSFSPSGTTPQDAEFFNQTKSLGKIRACFNRQIGLCPGVCTGEITKEEYAKQIENIILFFEGAKKRLINNLEKQMREFAKKREFEKANKVKRTLFTLTHIQDVALIKEDKLESKDSFRIESYDIAHMSGTNVVGVMTVVEDGEAKRSDYRRFRIRDIAQSRTLGGGQAGNNDTKALSEVLSRRLGHIEWKMPDLVVVDGGLAQKRMMERILAKNFQRIPVVSVVKDEHHRPKQILGDKKWLKYEREIILANSEAHRYGINYHKKLRDKIKPTSL